MVELLSVMFNTQLGRERERAGQGGAGVEMGREVVSPPVTLQPCVFMFVPRIAAF